MPWVASSDGQMKKAGADDAQHEFNEGPVRDNRVLRVMLVVDGAGPSSRRMKR
jgi:hypothetical protein